MGKRWYVFGVAFLLLLGGGLLAQQGSATEPAGKVQEEDLPRPVRPEVASPRATMQTFLEAFYQTDADGEFTLDEPMAVSCLDLSGLLPDVREMSGKELIIQLKEVIDRTELVDFEKISDLSEGDPYVFLRIPGSGEVTIARVDNGEWLFTKETVASLPELHRAMEDRAVVEGVERQAPELQSFSAWLKSSMPESLRERIFFLEYWQWIGLFALILLGFILDKLVVFILHGVVLRYLERRQQRVDLAMLRKSLRPIGLPFMALLWWVGIAWLGLPPTVLQVLIVALKFIVAVAMVLIAYRLVDLLSDFLARRADKTESKFDDLLVPLIRKSLKVFIVAFGIVFVADNLGTDVQGLLAGIGLGGLAVALAAKDAVSNLFGSLTVLLDRPFQVGDWVVIGSAEGTVEEVGFRSTRIRTFYNSLITLPNSILISASVDNLGMRKYRRWSTKLGLTYDTPPEKIDAFCEGVRELIRQHPYTRKDYFHVYMNEFDNASLNILLYVFFMAPDWATELRERHRLAVDIIRLAGELGVEFAFPTQTLYLREEKWSAPPRAGRDYPAESTRLQDKTRADAGNLVNEALGGTIPPPVVFAAPPPPDDAADMDSE